MSETRITSCTGKLQYSSPVLAHKRLRAQQKGRQRGKAMHAYRCSYCHFWHVGNGTG